MTIRDIVNNQDSEELQPQRETIFKLSRVITLFFLSQANKHAVLYLYSITQSSNRNHNHIANA